MKLLLHPRGTVLLSNGQSLGGYYLRTRHSSRERERQKTSLEPL